jgi:hypothetical protein
MLTRTKSLAVAIAMGAAVALAPVSGVSAQTSVGDGLVNVAVGDINLLNNVNVAVAAQVTALVCGLEVGPVNVLATQVDLGGAPATVCEADNAPVTILQ